MSARDHLRRNPQQWWVTHKLIACALAAAFAALCLAAADAMSTAGRAVVVAVAFALAAALRTAYRNLPPDLQRRVLSRPTVKRDLLLSTMLAIAVGCTYWFAGWIPVRSTLEFVAWLWPKLDVVPSVFAQLLPVGWKSGFHRYFNRMTYCFPGPFWWETMRYLRAAIPGYAVTFFVTFTFVRFARELFRSRLRR